MDQIKIVVHALPMVSKFAENVVWHLMNTLAEASVDVTMNTIVYLPDVPKTDVVVLICRGIEERERIRNGSVRPNISFQIELPHATGYSRDYAGPTLIEIIRQHCLRVQSDKISFLLPTPGLEVKSITELVGCAVHFEFNR